MLGLANFVIVNHLRGAHFRKPHSDNHQTYHHTLFDLSQEGLEAKPFKDGLWTGG